MASGQTIAVFMALRMIVCWRGPPRPGERAAVGAATIRRPYLTPAVPTWKSPLLR